LGFLLIACSACQQSHYLSGSALEVNAQDPLGLGNQNSPPPYIYYTMQTAESLNALNSGVVAHFDKMMEDPNGYYKPSAGTFTAPVNAIYTVVASLGIQGPWGPNAKCGLTLNLSGVGSVKEQIQELNTNDACNVTLYFEAAMTANQTAQIYFLNTDSGKTVDTDQSVTNFEITWQQ
jgi:hypothetical protein